MRVNDLPTLFLGSLHLKFHHDALLAIAFVKKQHVVLLVVFLLFLPQKLFLYVHLSRSLCSTKKARMPARIERKSAMCFSKARWAFTFEQKSADAGAHRVCRTPQKDIFASTINTPGMHHHRHPSETPPPPTKEEDERCFGFATVL